LVQALRQGGDMRRAAALARTFPRDTRGATATEYGLILAFIAVALLAAATLLGQTLSDFFQSLANRFAGW
jgi:pilus assembly protein Flp/PilA